MGELIDWREGAPFSPRYGDIYYSKEGGLAETQAVFLQGCGLPGGWAGKAQFVVGELGFGTGLNIAALLALWRRERPPGGRLHIFSIEAHPLAREDAARALGVWPELAEAANLLLAAWPGSREGFQRIELPMLNATFDLAVMEAAQALAAWSGKADAWFLDGFAPSKNPDMWRDEVLGLIAGRSAPGARLATFTVAGQVRRGLAEQGFEVRKVAGHGRKRERLEAALPGQRRPAAIPASVAVIGGGIAGAGLCRALTTYGLAAIAIADPADDGASANPAALVMPALDAGSGARAAFYAQAFAHAVRLYDEIEGAIIARGALQMETADRDRERFDKVAGQAVFEPGALGRVSADEVGARLGEPVARGGLWLAEALSIAPPTVLAAWRGEIRPGRVDRIVAEDNGWWLEFADGEVLRAHVVVVAAGWGSSVLRPDLPLSPVRGQVSLAQGVSAPVAAAFGGYLAPAPQGLMFGATHDRADIGIDIRSQDDVRNLATLAAVLPRYAQGLAGTPLTGRAAVRAVSPDRMPIAGEISPGLFVLTALGSRGFTTAPLLADHLAALIAGAPSPLPNTLAGLVAPERFGQASV